MEDAMKITSSHGKYKIFIIIMATATNFLCTLFTLQKPYFLKHPNFYIKEINSINNTITFLNNNKSMIYSKEYCDKSKYIMIKDPETSLNNWAYSFDIYCDRDKIGDIMIDVIFAGAIIGNIIFTNYPDKIGREKLFKVFLFASFFLQLNLIFNFGYIHIIITLFFIGLDLFIFPLAITIIEEFVVSDNKATILGVFNAFYPLGGILMSLFFLTINNWKCFYVINCILLAILLFFVYNYLYESPRWLHTNGKHEECIDVLNKISKINNVEEGWILYKSQNPQIINSLGGQINTNGETGKHYTFFDILNLKSQRSYMILSIFVWFTTSYCFYGVVLNLDNMKGGFFVNSILAFLGEMIAESTSGKFVDEYGGKVVAVWSSFLGAVAYILYCIGPKFLIWFFVFMAMFCFSFNFIALNLYTVKIFPTQIRGTAVSASYLISRIAPVFVNFFNRFIPKFTNLSFILAGLIHSAIFYYYLPETKGMPDKDFVNEDEYLVNLTGNNQADN